MLLQQRNDLGKTSSGVGHQLKSPLTFPPPNFKRTVLEPLPKILSHAEQVNDFYSTSTGSNHDFKPTSSVLSNGVHKKAPGHWKVDYSEDTIKKLQVKPQRKPLTMGNQSSEMKAQFSGRKGVSLETQFNSDIQPLNFRHHHTGGQLKQLVPSTHNPKLAGDKYYVQDRGVLSYHDDMYLTTTQKDHRAFRRNELEAYPRKEYGTYWECEGYPKAWGHGSRHNPLPPDSVPREKGPMRDSMLFKSATFNPRLPKSLEPVPHKGMRSEVQANFTSPPDGKRKLLFDCPVPTPWNIEGPGREEIFSIPRMYQTEYQFIGSKKQVVV